jgi:hypothetical protein
MLRLHELCLQRRQPLLHRHGSVLRRDLRPAMGLNSTVLHELSAS